MSTNKITRIEITSGTIVKSILFILLLVFLYLIRDVVGVVLFSVVIASAIAPAVYWLERYKTPRVLALVLIYLGAFLLLGSLFYIIIPPVFSELSELTTRFPAYFDENISGQYLTRILPEVPESASKYINSAVAELIVPLQNITGGFLSSVSYVFGGALSFIMVIILSFYLAAQEKGIENFLRVITPNEHESYIIDLWKRSRKKIGGWMQGQILLGVLVGVLVYLGLTILGIKYALVLAFLSAVFELIPVLGPVMAATPAVVIAFLQAPILGLWVLIFYFVVQQFENHLIYPLVVRKTTGVNPIMVILSLIIGGKIAGFVGVILAVPIAAVLVEFVNDIEKKKHPNANE